MQDSARQDDVEAFILGLVRRATDGVPLTDEEIKSSLLQATELVRRSSNNRPTAPDQYAIASRLKAHQAVLDLLQQYRHGGSPPGLNGQRAGE